MFLIVHLLKRLAVARTAAIVDGEDRVAVVDQVLDQRAVADARLAARSAVHPDQRGTRLALFGLMRCIQDSGDFRSVKGLEADHFSIDEIIRVNLPIEGVGQLFGRIGSKIQVKQISRHSAAGRVHRKATFVRRKRHRGNTRLRNLRQR